MSSYMTDEQRQLDALESALVAASNALGETDVLAGMADGKTIDRAIDSAMGLVRKWQRYATAEEAALNPRNHWDTWEDWRGER